MTSINLERKSGLSSLVLLGLRGYGELFVAFTSFWLVPSLAGLLPLCTSIWIQLVVEVTSRISALLICVRYLNFTSFKGRFINSVGRFGPKFLPKAICLTMIDMQ